MGRLPTEVEALQHRLVALGANVPPYRGDMAMGAYAALLRERVRVLESEEALWWRHT